MSFLLMSFTNTQPYNSNAYLLPIDNVETVLGRGNFSYSIISTRNETMAYFMVYYEVLKMNHVLIASSWVDTYSVDYMIETYLYTNVAYANGFLNLFTEYGNTKIVYNQINMSFSSCPSDLTILNHTRIASSNSSFRVAYPDWNVQTVNLSIANGSTMSYYTNQEAYYTDDEVSSFALNTIDTKYNTNTLSSQTSNQLINTFNSMDIFHYPNNVMNGESFRTYGTLSFSTNYLPTFVGIQSLSEGVISEGSPYGECRVSSSSSVNIIF